MIVETFAENFAESRSPNPPPTSADSRLGTTNPGFWIALSTALLLLLVKAAAAAEPCPWEGMEQSAACARWDALVERLEAAEERASTAESKLQAILETVKAAAGANTPDPDAPETKRVRRIVDGFLDSLGPPRPDIGGFEIDPAYVLTLENKRYTALFSSAAWVYAPTRVDFGPLKLTVEPLDDERANLTLRPGDIIHILEGGTTLAQLTIGDQRMEGVWDETLQNLTRSNINLGQLALSFTQAPVSAVLGSLEFSQTLERFEDDTWRSEQNLELGQLELRIAALTVGLERIEGNFSVDGRRFDTLRALNSQLLELLDNAPMPDADNENMEIFALTGKIYQLFNRLDANLKAINLTLVESDEPLAALGRVAMNGRYQARDDVDPAMLSYAFEMDRLQLGATSLPAGIAPTTARLEIKIGNIPAELLDRLGEIAVAGAQIEDESARRSYLNRQLLALLMGSRFRFQLTDSFISAPEARVDVNLRSAIEPTATFGGTGQLDLRIEGLQKLIDATGALDQEGMGIVLSILTVFSNRDQENGQVIDNYALEVTREGSVKLNGKDITALLLPSQPPPPQPRR